VKTAGGEASSGPGGRLETWLVGTLCALAVLPGRWVGVDHFDEGFIATGAMLIRSGAWPLRDFYSVYGPAQYAASAGLYTLLGEDIWVSRLADVATFGITGALVFTFVRRVESALPARLAALAFAAMVAVARPSANYAALTALPILIVAALLFGDWIDSRRLRALAAASLCVGVMATLRWDFGVYGLLALSASTALAVRSGIDRGAATRAMLVATLPAAGLGVAVYAFVLGTHAWQWFDETPRFLAREFAVWRNVDFVGPAFDVMNDAVRHGQVRLARDGALWLTFAIAPFLLIPLSAWRCARFARRPGARVDGKLGIVLLLSLCGLCFLIQMRVRPSLTQGLPAFACALMLFPWITARARWARSTLHSASLAALALLCWAGIGAQRQLWSTSAFEPAFERATAIRVPTDPASAEYAALIAYLRTTTAPTEAIFSGVADTSRLLFNDTMIYFLAARRPATRFMEMEPGLSNTAAGQREIVAELEREHVRTIVLWRKTSSEPNRTAVSNGVTTLDDYVQRNFALTRRFADYAVMTRADAAPLR
jgi:hypothetical protein